jgi:hypothetical protein
MCTRTLDASVEAQQFRPGRKMLSAAVVDMTMWG